MAYSHYRLILGAHAVGLELFRGFRKHTEFMFLRIELPPVYRHLVVS